MDTLKKQLEALDPRLVADALPENVKETVFLQKREAYIRTLELFRKVLDLLKVQGWKELRSDCVTDKTGDGRIRQISIEEEETSPVIYLDAWDSHRQYIRGCGNTVIYLDSTDHGKGIPWPDAQSVADCFMKAYAEEYE